jgi:hypothetical protein
MIKDVNKVISHTLTQLGKVVEEVVAARCGLMYDFEITNEITNM